MANQGKALGSYKQSDWAKPESADINGPTGILIGVVKQIVTASRDGTLLVYIPSLGADPEDSTAWVKVSYASPFLGTTQGYNNSLQLNSYDAVKQTYGFFMVPPDIGNQVLCCFPPGRGSVGVWFACLSPNLGKYSLPAGAPSTSYNNIDAGSLKIGTAKALQDNILPGTPYPVGEFNELDPNVFKSDWIDNLRPINPYAASQLLESGLDTDITRGAITSSVQRDPISSAYGFISPGRPIPSQDIKNQADLKQKIASGTFNPDDYKITNRIQGHSFLLDDGDLFGKNNLARLKTSAGHQILLNDSDGFIYISSSNGKTWLELNNNGDILIYASRDLSIRTQGNLQFHSDNEILFNAKSGLKMYSQEIALQADDIFSLQSKNKAQFHSGQIHVKADNDYVQASESASLKSAGTFSVTGSTINLNSGGTIEPSVPKQLNFNLLNDAKFENNRWNVQKDILKSICFKVPSHEPYLRAPIQQSIQEPTSTATTVTGEIINTSLQNISPEKINKTLQTAATFPVTNAAPTSSFIKQPNINKDIGSLSKDNLKALFAQAGHEKSNGNYSLVNDSGFIGKYQLDGNNLKDLGLIKPDAGTTLNDLSNPNNWIGASGNPASLNDFLNNSTMQEELYTNLAESTYAKLEKAGAISASNTQDEVAGILNVASAHGVDNAVGWLNGKLTNGEFAKTFQQGVYSQTQLSTIDNSNQSKTILGA